MTGTAISLLGFAVLLLVGLALEVVARRRPDAAVARAGEALGAAMRTSAARAAVLGTWIWIGVHFLAR